MRFALIAAFLVGRCAAAPALTTIQDTLYKADGTRFEGVAQIEWKSFQAADGSEIPQQTLNVKVTAGNLRVALVPTKDAAKPTAYTVKFNSNGKTQFVEFWSIPPSTVKLRLKDVRVQSGDDAGAITDGPVSITDVSGLRAELDVRPLKGSGFTTFRTAVINQSGALDGALGNAGDCVHVDGTSGPCGSGGLAFVDGETPSGTINGVNGNFTLSGIPSPPASLKLFRNGLLLREGTAYTISGPSIQLTANSIPTPGDILQAWYRLASNDTPTIVFSEDEPLTGLIDGFNRIFTLQNAPVPATSLQVFRNGVLQKSGVDYTLSVDVITFLPVSVPQLGDILQVSYRQ
ncbi:MAG TPA: hypothetical protein VEX68_07125 [Bryobacteraceae bacterium]|nr:hypothetical protein [Bryobacteraceae bacterium]